MIKKEPKIFGPLDRPIIVVGERMGKQRPGEDLYALEGNKTGDFVHAAIGDKRNIILTNVTNYYYEDKQFQYDETYYEGMRDLKILILIHRPRKIIALGGIAHNCVNSIRDPFIPSDCKVVMMPHPSYLRRFHSSQLYNNIAKLSHELI